MYKRVISVLGTKGGVGKSTLAHMIALGLSAKRIRSILMYTDHGEGRESRVDTTRPYTIYSAQTPGDLAAGMKAFQFLNTEVKPAVLVFDGGGNREQTDSVLARASDLIILPFRDSDEDLDVVLANAARMPEAFLLPNQWPTNHLARKHAKRYLDAAQAAAPGRVLPEVPAIRAAGRLLDRDFVAPDPIVTAHGSLLAVALLEKTGIDRIEPDK